MPKTQQPNSETTMQTEPLKVAVVGCGSRGQTYATYALEEPRKLRVVAIAEPDETRRGSMAERHGLDVDAPGVVDDWHGWSAEVMASFDAVIIATLDHQHEEPAIFFATRGKHLLLEKPMAPTLEACERIAAAVEQAGVMMAICHVYRYTPYTRIIKQLIDDAVIGAVQTVQHLEPVGWWHYAHSFVRGNWRREDTSSFMLMTKSCHDLDWLDHIMGGPPEEVYSTGGLRHFRKEMMPDGAAERCLDCKHSQTCPYSAETWYLGCLARGERGWPVDVLTADTSESGVRRALAEGPYGRCVYQCDNDVVDTQHVIGTYADGRSFTFTMTAFSADGGRKTRIFGDRGLLEYDGVEPIRTSSETRWKPATLRHLDFVSGRYTYIDIDPPRKETALTGHGGGDYDLMQAWTEAIRTGNRSLLLSDASASLRSHRTVFEAEASRRQGRPIRR